MARLIALISLLIPATFAASAHADSAQDYKAATDCVGMYEFMALMTPADHPNMLEIKKRSFAWADYARTIRPADRKTTLVEDATYSRDYLLNVVRPEGKAALLKHLEPLQKTCGITPVITAPKPNMSNPFELATPSAAQNFSKAVQCAGVYELSVNFGDALGVQRGKAFADLAKAPDPNIQTQDLEAKIKDEYKQHTKMMVSENAKSQQIAQMCKSALKNM